MRIIMTLMGCFAVFVQKSEYCPPILKPKKVYSDR